MARPEPARRLIVNADDFGRSHSINAAVILAHNRGILTTASLMVNEPACPQAVVLARENPRLGVGLHLSLVCGRAALPDAVIPGLIDQPGYFSENPVTSGLRYFACPSLRDQLRREIRTQFEKFLATGLPLDHVNGHLNMHLHPVILGFILENAARFNLRHLRLTRDPFFLNARLSSGQWLYRSSHAFIYLLLSAWARPLLRRRGIQFTHQVFGLLQNARVDHSFVSRLLPALPPGDSELYSHPSLDEFKSELDALLDPQVRTQVRQLGIQLIRYQDLPTVSPP